MKRHHWLTLLGILLFPLALYWRVRFNAECEAWRRTRNRPRRWSEKLVRETGGDSATEWDITWGRRAA